MDFSGAFATFDWLVLIIYSVHFNFQWFRFSCRRNTEESISFTKQYHSIVLSLCSDWSIFFSVASSRSRTVSDSL